MKKFKQFLNEALADYKKDAEREAIAAAMKNFKGKVTKLPPVGEIPQKKVKKAPQGIYFSDDTDIDILNSEVEKALKKNKLGKLKLMMHTPSSDRKTMKLLYTRDKANKMTDAQVVSALKKVFASPIVSVNAGVRGFNDGKQAEKIPNSYDVFIKTLKRGTVIDYLK